MAMVSNIDTVRLFVLLSATKLTTTYSVKNNAKYLLGYFPGWTEDKLCEESQRVVKQLSDSELQKNYGEQFCSLPIDQRYPICLEAPVYFSYNDDIFARWLEAYNVAKEKWFTTEELRTVKEKIKKNIERIRYNAQMSLEKVNPSWIHWENAKERLFVQTNFKPESFSRNVLHQHTNHMAGDHYIFLKSPDFRQVYFVTPEEVCLWGKHSSIVWAEATYNGRYLKSSDGTLSPKDMNYQLMPSSLYDLPESQWEEQVYKYNQDLKKWTDMLLGKGDYTDDDIALPSGYSASNSGSICNDRSINAAVSVEQASNNMEINKPITAVDRIAPHSTNASVFLKENAIVKDVTEKSSGIIKKNTVGKKKTTKDNSMKTSLQFLGAIDQCWKIIDDLIPFIGKEMEICDQDARKYTLLCTTRSRRNAFKRNSKELIEPTKNIEKQLIEYAREYESIWMWMLCFNQTIFWQKKVRTICSSFTVR